MNHGGLPTWFFWLLDNAHWISWGLVAVLAAVVAWWIWG